MLENKYKNLQYKITRGYGTFSKIKINKLRLIIGIFNPHC